MNQLFTCVASRFVLAMSSLFVSSLGYGHTMFSDHHFFKTSVDASGSLPFFRLRMNSDFNVRIFFAYLRLRSWRNRSS